MSSIFDIFSGPGQGSIVLSRIANKQAPPTRYTPSTPGFEFGAICAAVTGEVECGDAWCIARSADETAILVADGLGHRPLAARASGEAVKRFKQEPLGAPSMLMKNLHTALGGGRGAAAACAVLQLQASKVIYAGVGNISGHLLTGERSRGMVSHNGTLGVQLLRSQQFEYDWKRGSRMVMHSDGILGRWSVDSYPGLNMKHPAIIAGVLYRDFVRRRDDATIVVGCQR